MEEDIRLVVFEHLRDKLRVHILDVDFLEILVEHHDRFIQLLLQIFTSVVGGGGMAELTDHIDDDAREQKALLVLMWAFLDNQDQLHVSHCPIIRVGLPSLRRLRLWYVMGRV
jgi:hypothetical protein